MSKKSCRVMSFLLILDCKNDIILISQYFVCLINLTKDRRCSILMKKNILLAVISMLVYYVGFDIMYYTGLIKVFDSFTMAIMLVAFPAIPGIALIFACIKDSWGEYLKALGMFFLICLGVMVLYVLIHIGLTMVGAIESGDSKWGLAVWALSKIVGYIPAFLVGTAVSGVITFSKKKKAQEQ